MSKESRRRLIVVSVISVIFMLILGSVLYVWALPPLELTDEERKQVLDYLGHKPITIEVAYVTNNSPSFYAIYLLTKRIETYSETPKVDVIIHEIPRLYDNYTTRELIILEQSYRQTFTDENSTSLFILYVNGQFEGQDTASGLTYSLSSFAVFKEFFTDFMADNVIPVKADSYEASVLIHEFGHIFGLINIGYTSPLDHQSHGNHCNNPRCVMFYTVVLIIITTKEPPTDYDFQCQEDIVLLKQSAGIGSGWDILQYRIIKRQEEITFIGLLAIVSLITTYFILRRRRNR